MREKKLIHVYDIDMSLVAILENAYQIGYELEANNLWKCSFKLPLNDPKNEEVTPKRFIELWDHDKRIGMFVVNPKHTVKNESTREITYNCEHVLSTLHSEVLFGYHQFTNFTTEEVLQALIDEQETKHWRLGTVEFTRYFHYAWEHEDSLLNALFSVPKPFDESYIWTWDDTKYPFTLNLVRPSDVKVDVVRAGKNLKGIEIEVDPTNIINRIYPLGYGEGVNQLTIKEVNGGVEYLEDSESIQKYGLQKKIWVDRRFEDPKSLKASAQAFLDKYKEPLKTVAIDLIDYRHLDPYKVLDYNTSDIIGVYDEDTETEEDLRIMKITKRDIYGNTFDIQLEVGNVRQNIGMTISDLQKKQLVNETYSQGSTNIFSMPYSDNCDPDNPMVIRLKIWEDVKNINVLTLTLETHKFRAYSKATQGGGAISKTTAGGGQYVSSGTTAAGGATVQSSTTSAGGGSVETTSSNGEHRHRMYWYDGEDGSPVFPLNGYMTVGDAQGQSAARVQMYAYPSDLYTDEASGEHSHVVNLSAHSHNFSFSIPDHSHSFNFTIPDHVHPFELPDHIHEILYGIYEYDDTATSITVTVDGNEVPVSGTSLNELDLIPYLQLTEEGRLRRGEWIEIKITPNNLARINALVTTRMFIQSRTGDVY